MNDMRKLDVAAAEPVDAKRQRRWPRLLLMAVVPLILLAAGGWFYLSSLGKVSTNNAYVQQDRVPVSADVSGRIVAVAVSENQRIDKGALLFRIDPEPYRIAVLQADAAVASARLQVAQLRAGVVTEAVGIRDAAEGERFAEIEYARQAELLAKGFTTRARYDEARHRLEQARAAVSKAHAEAGNAAAALGNVRGPVDRHPLVLAALAQREKAALDFARTTVRAPVAGIATQTERLQVGSLAASGLPLVSIVRSDTPAYVEANFKETDLDEIRVGQRATVTLDAYPGTALAARVASIGAGTGSEFSVLPAQNASGNWVKVTQRVPVRLTLEPRAALPLVAGLSAKVTVLTN